jgi:hypothetical protein
MMKLATIAGLLAPYAVGVAAIAVAAAAMG